MKIAARDVAGFCADPPPNIVGVLLYGEDGGLVAERRRILTDALGAGDDLIRISAADARRSPATVETALTTAGFFADRAIVLVEGATDGMTKGLAPILSELTEGGGILVLTGGWLPARSSLRKLFETQGNLAAAPLFSAQMTVRDIEHVLRDRGLRAGVTQDGLASLVGLADGLDFGSFSRFLDLLAVRGLGSENPLDERDVMALAPVGLDGDLDSLAHSVAEGDLASLHVMMRRLTSAGTAPVGMLLALQRHFRLLLTANAGANGLSAVRPPIQGPRRDRIQRQLRIWTVPRLEQAARLLFEADGNVRSTGRAPDLAIVERAALRLAIMARR